MTRPQLKKALRDLEALGLIKKEGDGTTERFTPVPQRKKLSLRRIREQKRGFAST